MTDSLPYMAALLIGFGSSAHCLGMCGGIAASTGLTATAGSQSLKFMQLLLFHFGRIATYCLLGLIAGLALHLLPDGMNPLFIFLRLLAGLLMIAMGLYLGNWWRGLARIEQAAEPFWRRIQPLLRRTQGGQPGMLRSFRLGLLWGFLPCGLVYSTLAWAATATASPAAALLMLCMGLGTLPALLPVSIAGTALLRSRLFRRLSSAALVLFGLWTIWFPVRAMLGLLMAATTGTEMPHMHH